MTIPPPTEPLDDVEMRWYITLWQGLADPRTVTVMQIVTGLFKAVLGVLLIVDRPDFLMDVAGGIPAIIIGGALTLGGVAAAWGAWRNRPILEELGLRFAQLGLVGLFTVFATILWNSAGRSFLLTLLALLVGMAVLDAEKRIRRLRWDRVHPLRTV